jgi:hypothetical protein
MQKSTAKPSAQPIATAPARAPKPSQRAVDTPIVVYFSTICRLTPIQFRTTLSVWLDSLRVESVTTKSTHFVALPEYPRNSPHRAAWVSSLSHLFSRTWLLLQTGLAALARSLRIPDVSRPTLMPGTETVLSTSWDWAAPHAVRRRYPPDPARPQAPLLERNQSNSAQAKSIEGGFFLRKKPLGGIAPGVYLLWFRSSRHTQKDPHLS